MSDAPAPLTDDELVRIDARIVRLYSTWYTYEFSYLPSDVEYTMLLNDALRLLAEIRRLRADCAPLTEDREGV